jgi:hypothetical protein
MDALALVGNGGGGGGVRRTQEDHLVRFPQMGFSVQSSWLLERTVKKGYPAGVKNYVITITVFLAASCGSGSHGPNLGTPPQGSPLSVPADQWTWVDFPETSCDDGSPTGIGVYNASASKNLLVFLNGGGACWDYDTCFTINSAVHGPFGKPEFDAAVASLPPGTAFDRNDPTNPFSNWSYVYIPYCTGDVHSGDNVITYTKAGATMLSKTYHHKGHANVLAYLKRLGSTFTAPSKVVISGSSAGGFGSMLNYVWFRWYWPKAQMYLVDDSGPPLESGDIPDSFVSAWLPNWHLDQVLTQLCGMTCLNDFSLGVTALVQYYPHDRLSLLSSLEDKTISGYFLMSATGFQNALLTMAKDRIAPTKNFSYFFVSGNTHTMLGNMNMFTSVSTTLPTWLTQMVTDDPAWKSTQP